MKQVNKNPNSNSDFRNKLGLKHCHKVLKALQTTTTTTNSKAHLPYPKSCLLPRDSCLRFRLDPFFSG